MTGWERKKVNGRIPARPLWGRVPMERKPCTCCKRGEAALASNRREEEEEGPVESTADTGLNGTDPTAIPHRQEDSKVEKVEESVESVHMKTLKQIRQKFQPFNIYIHRCNKCHEIGQMLHE